MAMGMSRTDRERRLDAQQGWLRHVLDCLADMGRVVAEALWAWVRGRR